MMFSTIIGSGPAPLAFQPKTPAASKTMPIADMAGARDSGMSARRPYFEYEIFRRERAFFGSGILIGNMLDGFQLRGGLPLVADGLVRVMQGVMCRNQRR